MAGSDKFTDERGRTGGLRGPSECPDCAHDPMGDDETFTSGGGWVFDNSVADGVFTEELRCPVCEALVWQKEKTRGEPRR